MKRIAIILFFSVLSAPIQAVEPSKEETLGWIRHTLESCGTTRQGYFQPKKSADDHLHFFYGEDVVGEWAFSYYSYRLSDIKEAVGSNNGVTLYCSIPGCVRARTDMYPDRGNGPDRSKPPHVLRDDTLNDHVVNCRSEEMNVRLARAINHYTKHWGKKSLF